jgi:sortase A
LLTAGAITLLFVCYLVWGSGLRAASAQRAFASELNSEWAHAPLPGGTGNGTGNGTGSGSASGSRTSLAASQPALPERFDAATGQPFAFIQIPAFGKSWRFALIEGTALAQLNVSPGHVPGTQWPGQLGNFAVAGHRVTSGNPFWSLPSLQSGDLVDIQTELNDYTYRVIGKEVVSPADLGVLDPVPGHPGKQPTQRLITLITCDPAWTGTHRVIVTGVLVSAEERLCTAGCGSGCPGACMPGQPR